jgi:hypothetical protein
MGRYYEGDISGKFWFGVQSSDDASFFGGSESEPNYLNYYFSTDDLPDIEEGIAKCVAALGENKQKFETFFGEGGQGENGYTDTTLKDALAVTDEEVGKLLEWWARLELGEEIRKCVVEKGECSFEAEL